MIDWELWITKATNGYIVRWMEELENGNIRQYHGVFQDTDEFNPWGDHEAMVRCLYFVLEHFGLGGSKHDEKRIRIELAGGQGEDKP